MLPPGMLQRLELVAEWLPPGWREGTGEAGSGGWSGAESDAAPDLDAAEAAIRDELAVGPRPVRDLDGSEGRAVLLRRLRGMAARGLIGLEWTLTAASAGPRFERWLALTDEGRSVAAAVAAATLRPS